MEQKPFWRIESFTATQPEAVTTASSSTKFDGSNGKILGFTISEPYANDLLSQMLVSVENNSKTLLKEVSANTLKPQTGKLYIPFDEPLSQIVDTKITIKSLTGSSQAAKPLVFNFYFENPSPKKS